MKEKELREHSKCSACKKGILHTGVPLFWVVKVSRHGVLMSVLQRQTGMEQLMGGHVALAQILGPQEDMTQPMMEEKTLTFCEDCMINFNTRIMSLTEE